MSNKITELYRKVVGNQGKCHACLTEEEFMRAMEEDHPELVEIRKTQEQQDYLEALQTMLRQFNDHWRPGNKSMWIYFDNKSGRKLSADDVYNYISKTFDDINKYVRKYGEIY